MRELAHGVAASFEARAQRAREIDGAAVARASLRVITGLSRRPRAALAAIGLLLLRTLVLPRINEDAVAWRLSGTRASHIRAAVGRRNGVRRVRWLLGYTVTAHRGTAGSACRLFGDRRCIGGRWCNRVAAGYRRIVDAVRIIIRIRIAAEPHGRRKHRHERDDDTYGGKNGHEVRAAHTEEMAMREEKPRSVRDRKSTRLNSSHRT